MDMIPKVKSVKVTAQIGTGIIQNKLCVPGEFTPGKLPLGKTYRTVRNARA